MAPVLRPSGACIAIHRAPANNKLRHAYADAFAVAKACTARALPHTISSRIAAVHVDAALVELAAFAAFWGEKAATRPASLAGAWAARQQAAAPAPALSADAEDVVPRLHTAAAVTPYTPPARREGATAAALAGWAPICPAPAPAQPAPRPAPYVPPYRLTAEQQATAAEAGRPGRCCAFPCLTAGPLPQPTGEAPLPLYLFALLSPGQRC